MHPIKSGNPNRPPTPPLSEAGPSPRISDVRSVGASSHSSERMQTTASIFHGWTLDKINDEKPVINCLIEFRKKEVSQKIGISGVINGVSVFGNGTFISPHLRIQGFATHAIMPENETAVAYIETKLITSVLKKSIVKSCTKETLQLVEDINTERGANAPACLLFKTNVTRQMRSLSKLIQQKSDHLNETYLFADESSPVKSWGMEIRDNLVKMIVKASDELRSLGSTETRHNPLALYSKWALLSGPGSGGDILIRDTDKDDPEGKNSFTMHYRQIPGTPFSINGVSGYIRGNNLTFRGPDQNLLSPLQLGAELIVHVGCNNFYILASGPHTYLLRSENAYPQKSKNECLSESTSEGSAG